jgi:flagellar biosynthesis/type III secretory pathway protein FliH
VGRGGCRLVSELGEVDATLERRLDELEATLRAGLEQQA